MFALFLLAIGAALTASACRNAHHLHTAITDTTADKDQS